LNDDDHKTTVRSLHDIRDVVQRGRRARRKIKSSCGSTFTPWAMHAQYYGASRKGNLTKPKDIDLKSARRPLASRIDFYWHGLEQYGVANGGRFIRARAGRCACGRRELRLSRITAVLRHHVKKNKYTSPSQLKAKKNLLFQSNVKGLLRALADQGRVTAHTDSNTSTLRVARKCRWLAAGQIRRGVRYHFGQADSPRQCAGFYLPT